MTPPKPGPHRGIVASFDEVAGHGRVGDDDNDTDWWFHCTALADGSRSVKVGQSVIFRVVAGHNGRWEAAQIVKTD